MKMDSTLALTREELVLLKYSEEGKDEETYGNLYEIAKKYITLKKKDINNDKFDDIAKLILRSGKDSLFTNIITEWSARKIEDMADIDQNIRCQLCGTKNKYIYYIVNKLNQSELHVGSSCIKKFAGIENISEIIKQFRSNIAVRDELRRKNAFLKEYPNADYFTTSIRRDFYNFPILLPLKLYNSLDKEISNLMEIYDTFKAKGNINNIDSVIKEFKESEETYNVLNQQAAKIKMDREKSENQSIICKRREYRWLLDNGKDKLFNKIAEDEGLYTSDTIKEIYNHEYLLDLKPLIERCCEGTDLNLKEIRYEDKKIVFHINDKVHRDILEITVSEEQFMRGIGWRCVFDNHYKIKINPEIFSLTDSKQNINIILSRVNRVISKTEYLIEYNYDEESGRLYLEKKLNETYLIIGTGFFLKRYLQNINLSDTELRKAYLNNFYILDKDSGWKLIKERMERREFERMMAKENMGRKKV